MTRSRSDADGKRAFASVTATRRSIQSTKYAASSELRHGRAADGDVDGARVGERAIVIEHEIVRGAGDAGGDPAAAVDAEIVRERGVAAVAVAGRGRDDLAVHDQLDAVDGDGGAGGGFDAEHVARVRRDLVADGVAGDLEADHRTAGDERAPRADARAPRFGGERAVDADEDAVAGGRVAEVAVGARSS